jgi:hypothetical protein
MKSSKFPTNNSHTYSWQNSTKWGGWTSPFSVDEHQLAQQMDEEKCNAERPEWPYSQKSLASKAEVAKILLAHVQETRQKQLDSWRQIEEFSVAVAESTL